MRKGIVFTVALTGFLIVAGCVVTQASSEEQRPLGKFEAFTVDDAMRFMAGKDVEKKPIQAGAIVIQIDDDRRLVIDLKERRPGLVSVWAGGLGMDGTPNQLIVLKPSAANVVGITSELITED